MYGYSVWAKMAGFAQLALISAAVIMISGAIHGASAQSTVRVGIDEARIVPLVKSPSTVIIGNPTIADVSVQNGNLMVVMGKSYGTTNIIALDGAGEEIANLGLNVTTSGNHEVSLYRGPQRATLSCAPRCEEELNVGDASEQFERVLKQSTSKMGLADESSQQDSGGE
jgi:Flp pilus assembly secretin CpaC